MGEKNYYFDFSYDKKSGHKKEKSMTEIEKEENEIKRIEALRRKSYHCLSRKEKRISNSIYDDTGKDVMKKIILISFTSILTYYGFFDLLVPLITDNVHIPTLHIILLSIIFGLTFIGLFIFVIKKADFNKTEFLIYTIIYTALSTTGVITYVKDLAPITAYQVINTFIYIFITQVVILFIAKHITKRVVCNKIETDII